MGQKVNPAGFRCGALLKWPSSWCAKNPRHYVEKLDADLAIRSYLKKKLKGLAAVGQITIDDFTEQQLIVSIPTAKPGTLLGKKGELLEKIKSDIRGIIKSNAIITINVTEIKRPERDAHCIAFDIVQQLERRMSYKRAMKAAIQRAMKAGAEGIKIRVSGRLNGAEIARAEWLKEGKLPLHTLKAHVDYATAEAKTTYGIIGVKVFVYNGNINVKTVSSI